MRERMNQTKWNELFHAFYQNQCDSDCAVSVFYRTKARNGFISSWDNLWEHFGCEFENWKHLEWLQIELTDENRGFVTDTLKQIHVPGEIQRNFVFVYACRQDCDDL